MAQNVTTILQRISDGDREAFDRLVPQIYDQLKAIAHNHLKNERIDHTIGTTALVHEVYLRMMGEENASWENRAQFFAVASTVMRRILVDYARARTRQKRGGGAEVVELDEERHQLDDELAEEILTIHEALERLEKFNQRGAKIIQYRFFSGLTLKETAEIMDLTFITTRRSWETARAWIRVELGDRYSMEKTLGAPKD